MVSIQVSKEFLLRETGATEKELLEALPQVKAGVEENGELLTLEVTGDRPDLLGRYGVARALKGYFGKETGIAQFKLAKSKTKLTVEASVKKVRPFALAAFARGLRFDDESVRELMQLQEKLVLTHGRRRRKVAVGVHDAATVRGDLVYKAVGADFEFTPLGWDRPAPISKIMKEHEKGREYAFCLNGRDYPLFCDEEGVLSMPPIINSQRTAVKMRTTDLLLDVTGTDWEACNVALNILCHEFAAAGAKIEAIESDGRLAPETKPHEMLLSLDGVNKLLGVAFKPAEAVKCLRKQRLDATEKNGVLACLTPRYRADFLHPVDLIEEIALGHGYNSFKPKQPSMFTKGSVCVETLQEDKARDALASAGFVEALSRVLCNEDAAFKALSETRFVKIKNPISKEYGSLRGELLPSLLGLLSANTHNPYPQRVFEAGEVVVRGGKEGTQTKRHACAVACHSAASLTEAAAALRHLLESLGVADYALHPCGENRFMKGRQARVMIDGKAIGVIGEVHPQVLENFGLQMPCVAFEVRLDELPYA